MPFYGEDGTERSGQDGRMAELTREIVPEQAAQLNLRIFWQVQSNNRTSRRDGHG